MIVRRAVCLLLLAAFVGAGSAAAALPAEPPATVEVIVELEPPPAALRGFGGETRAARVRAARSLAEVAEAQRAFARRLSEALPSAAVERRYRIVLDALSVRLPPAELARLSALAGVAAVYPSVRYRPLLDSTPPVIGAPTLWGAGLEHGGEGIRIGIIDDGVDPGHPFFDPSEYVAPPGFPRGSRAFTSAKVIVARAFAPAGAGWRHSSRPFDPVLSFHGTHVAGIAAGNRGTRATGASGPLSGIAPRAFIGNYKALTVPTPSGLGLNGNTPELVAAVEAAVEDGMDVINLSLGEPEIEPARDALAKALDNAAAAGVVPVVAAGNDFTELGRGSVSSPGSAAAAITVAAVTRGGVAATFSASGPTPLGLSLKPDVAAPGVGVLSAVPPRRYEILSGTSMAAPHVAGAAALLLELHPDWSAAQVKSALVLTGRPVRGPGGISEASSLRQGGGLVDLPAAASPLVSASPQVVGLGLLDVSGGPTSARTEVALDDAGGGRGAWRVSLRLQAPAAGAEVVLPAAVEVPGVLAIEAAAETDAAEGERTGFVELERDGVVRRLPLWFRVTRPALGAASFRRLAGPGTYRGDTSRGEALVERYRYPDDPALASARLPGPEQVFRTVLERPAANLGVAVLRTARGVDIEPRIVLGADENRLAGAAALPYVENPYLPSFLEPAPTAAALLPAAGVYSLVFDTPAGGRPGPFRFRFWVDDVAPPRVRLLSRHAAGGRLLARARDAGSGIDPEGISFTIDGGPPRSGRFDARRGLAVLDLAGTAAGRHRLVLTVSDRQETKNNENVARILPNTRVLRAVVTVPGRGAGRPTG